MILKQKLLSLNIFKDNKYLDRYIELITQNKATTKIKFITEQHHIIPRIYYKHTKQQLDNSADNLVHLKYCDHVLAHCLLALAFEDTYFISASIDGIYAVLNSFNIYSTLEEFVADYEEVKDVLKCKHFVTPEQKAKLSNISASSRWYNNGIKETFNRVCPEGWQPGRIPRSKQAKENQSKYASNCHWYNNGSQCTFSKYCPEGWVAGRIMTKNLLNSQKQNAQKSAAKTKIPGKYDPKTKFRWYNDGIKECRSEQKLSSPWMPGRLENTRIKIKETKGTRKRD